MCMAPLALVGSSEELCMIRLDPPVLTLSWTVILIDLMNPAPVPLPRTPSVLLSVQDPFGAIVVVVDPQCPLPPVTILVSYY